MWHTPKECLAGKKLKLSFFFNLNTTINNTNTFRLKIAAMHYNENAMRSHAVTAVGMLRYAIVYPKYKHGDCTEDQPYQMYDIFLQISVEINEEYRINVHALFPVYVDRLMELLFDCVVEDAKPYQEFSDQITMPEPLCAQFDRPDKQEAVSRHRSRFIKNP